jgi:hypothetical protein
MFVFVFKHKDQSRVAVVVASDADDAFEQLTHVDSDSDIEYVRRWWEIIISQTTHISGPILDANIDNSEGYQIFGDD